jgi:hypothetical protein
MAKASFQQEQTYHETAARYFRLLVTAPESHRRRRFRSGRRILRFR